MFYFSSELTPENFAVNVKAPVPYMNPLAGLSQVRLVYLFM